LSNLGGVARAHGVVKFGGGVESRLPTEY